MGHCWDSRRVRRTTAGRRKYDTHSIPPTQECGPRSSSTTAASPASRPRPGPSWANCAGGGSNRVKRCVWESQVVWNHVCLCVGPILHPSRGEGRGAHRQARRGPGYDTTGDARLQLGSVAWRKAPFKLLVHCKVGWKRCAPAPGWYGGVGSHFSTTVANFERLLLHF